jgi:AraC-like DNA-binding protein
MNSTNKHFEQLTTLIAEQTSHEGPNSTIRKDVITFKKSVSSGKSPIIDHPAIWIIAKGQKSIYIGNKEFVFKSGDLAVLLLPMALECEFKSTSLEDPFLMASLFIDLGQLADVSLKLDRIDGAIQKPDACDPSSMFSIPFSDNLIDPFIRLFTVLNNRKEAEFLGQSIIDEIYFRLLSTDRGGQMRYFLEQRGEIQRISKAVEHIHQNLGQPVSVESLADMVHMSQTSFYENFKKVLHVSPLQYAKSVKLDRAQALIREGKKANEAGFLVGYNSPAQFSREYKRHFGFAPSATL